MKRCACILTHGRANACATISTLRNRRYRGDIVLILDDEDETIDEYRKNYADVKIRTFCKAAEMKREFSGVDNFDIHGTVLYARNATWQIMRDEGYDEFVMLDDDYTEIEFKWPEGSVLKRKNITDLQSVFDIYFRFLEASDADVVCFAQGGDYIGGGESSSVRKWMSRKAMNVYFFRTSRPYYFTGAMNDDVNTYLLGNVMGKRIFTPLDVSIVQKPTQKNGGGLTKMYLDYGTYVKSFYSVIVCPSATKIYRLGDAASGKGIAHWRIHHNIKWNNVAPKIVSSKWRKNG